MAIYNKRAKFTREQLLDHYLKRNSITNILYTIARVIGIVVQNLYCISSYLVLSWLVLLPVNWLKSDLYSKLENYLYNSLLFIVSSWSLAAGLTVVESGDEFKHLIEEPEVYYPETIKNNEHSCRSKHRTGAGKKLVSKNTGSEKYFDSHLDSNQKNAIGTRNNVINGQNDVHTKTKNELKNHSLNGIETANRINGLTNSIYSSVTNRVSSPMVTEGMNKYLTSSDGKTEVGEFNEKHFDHEDRVFMISAETNGLVNHNNNIISENNHITAKGVGHSCNGLVKHNTKELALSPRTITSNVNEVRQDTLKNIQDKPRILFLCNHISTADVPLIMQSFSTLTNQSILWVLDAQFKFTNFGVVCGSHGDFFVAKNSFVDGSLREHVLKHGDRNLLVLFPEGGFLRKRIDGSNRYATKNNLPLTKYVTHPRFGAFKDLIDPSVGITHIVDATLMYDNIKNPPSILDIVFGNKREPAILHYKVFKRSEIDPTEEWLRNIWLEKDKLLTDYYENRASVFKRVEDTFRVASLDWFNIISVHLFFFLVCYLTMFRLFNATSVTMLKARELYYSNI